MFTGLALLTQQVGLPFVCVTDMASTFLSLPLVQLQLNRLCARQGTPLSCKVLAHTAGLQTDGPIDPFVA